MTESRTISAFLLLTAVLLILVLASCRSVDVMQEVPFGTSAEVGPITIETAKIDEGSLSVTLNSIAPEPLDVTISAERTLIGYDYSRTAKNKSNKNTYAKFDSYTFRLYLDVESSDTLTMTLQNWYKITQQFTINLEVDVTGVAAKWRFVVPVRDVDLYENPDLFWKLNRTDYWHPRLVEDSWREYERSLR